MVLFKGIVTMKLTTTGTGNIFLQIHVKTIKNKCFKAIFVLNFSGSRYSESDDLRYSRPSTAGSFGRGDDVAESLGRKKSSKVLTFD